MSVHLLKFLLKYYNKHHWMEDVHSMQYSNRIWLHLCNISLQKKDASIPSYYFRIEFVILFDFWSVHYALYSNIKGNPNESWFFSITWIECTQQFFFVFHFIHCLSKTFWTQHAHWFEGIFKLLWTNITKYEFMFTKSLFFI